MIDFLGTLWQIFGGAARYVVWVDGGWSGYAIQDALRAHGVRARYMSITGPFINFYASRRDDWKAQGIMRAYGINYAGGRKFNREPFLPGAQGQGQPGSAAAMPTAGGHDWAAQAQEQLQARRAKRGR